MTQGVWHMLSRWMALSRLCLKLHIPTVPTKDWKLGRHLETACMHGLRCLASVIFSKLL